MSNKVVPQTYRQIIDKVIASVRPDFEENGIEENVLAALQQSWEAKLAQSRVADFSSDARLGAYQRMLPPLEDSVKDTSVLSNGNSGKTDGLGATVNGVDVKPEQSPQQGSSSASSSAKNGSSSSSKAKPAPATESNELGSDLDESDSDLLSDGEDGDDEDGGTSRDDGDVIIALYEKVQRVKNKWKITLKDGIISAEGKDYLFGKCQGEFEW